MKKFIIIGVVVVSLMFAIVVGKLMDWHYTNEDQRYRNLISAKQQSNEATYDTMWKILKQQASVTNEYKETFKEVYPKLIEGRYQNGRGDALLSFITESNPNFDTSLYKQLSASIEAQRTSFLRSQKEILDMKRVHDNIRTTVPGKWFIGDVEEIEIVVVTSKKSKKVFEDGEDNDIELFQ